MKTVRMLKEYASLRKGKVEVLADQLADQLIRDKFAEAVDEVEAPQRAKRLSASSVDNKAISAGARG